VLAVTGAVAVVGASSSSLLPSTIADLERPLEAKPAATTRLAKVVVA
jgi:hypothetical protein